MSEQQYQLIVQKGPQPEKVFLLITDVVTIGRDPMADISINDPEVSRHHVRLTQTASGYVLEDMGSTNGTFLDGEKLDPETPIALVNGQTIGMGSGVTLLYETPAPEHHEEPAEAIADDLFDAVSPILPELELGETDDPEFDNTPPLPDLPPSSSAPVPPPPTQTPLVPSGQSEQQQKRRRMITIAVIAIVLLCCCCLLFMLSAYFYWGDPLMESLGLY